MSTGTSAALALLADAAEAHSILESRTGVVCLLIVCALCMSGAIVVLFAPGRGRAHKAAGRDREQLRRLESEFARYKIRTEEERDKASRYRLEALVIEILPVLDSLERALGAAQPPVLTSAESLREGVQLTQQQLLTALRRVGIDAFDPTGWPFDPRYHDAVQVVDSTELPAGSVATVYQRGCRYGERLLRPARVAVVRGPESATAPETEVQP